MDFQVGFNILMGISGFLCVYVLLGNKSEHEELEKENKYLSGKLQGLEITMVRDFATNERLEKIGGDIFAKLNKIEEQIEKKLEKKLDK